MNTKIHINQFSPSITMGDGVSNGILFFQKLLTTLGFKSKIYSRHIDPCLSDLVFPLDSYIQNPNNWVLYHYSILDEDAEKIITFSDHKIIVYHNITPAHFFQKNSFLYHICTLARKQLENICPYFENAITDSQYNAQELNQYIHTKSLVLPILSDEKKYSTPDKNLIQSFKNYYTILFVGRLAPNKCQHLLIETVYYLKLKGIPDIKLILVGANSDNEYTNFLKERVHLLELDDIVIITGKVNEEMLEGYYCAADLYLSLSDHEGFGIPLIEAMRHNIPVLAYASTAIKENISSCGKLLKKSPDFVGNAIINIMNSHTIRSKICKDQDHILNRFSTNTLLVSLQAWLKTLNITPYTPYHQQTTLEKTKNILIEGPFDSTYSLAKVNRDIANSFYANSFNVALHSTEGGGDFVPNEEFLNLHLDISSFYKNYSSEKIYDIVIRNLYPPRTNFMKGKYKIFGPYGWEESIFPSQYINAFNQRLDVLWCMSQYVEKTMIDNGLKITSLTSGIIADGILKEKSQAMEFSFPKGWYLLHISSAFPRKGIDVLISAYMHFYTLHNDGILLIKTFPNPHNMVLQELTNNHFNEIKKLSHIASLWKRQDGASIIWINGDISLPQMRFLYEITDVLVAPSRGEGFGLPMAEAMFLNVPVVTTGYGGQCDFCTDTTSWLIDYSFSKAKTHMNLFDSVWVDPKIEDLVNQLCLIKNSTIQEKEKKLNNAYSFVTKNYSFDAFSKKIPLLLEYHDENTPTVKHFDRLGLISTWNTRCGIATYSEHLLKYINIPTTILAPYSEEIIQKDNSFVIRCWDEKSNDNLEILAQTIEINNITIIMIQFNYNFFDFNSLAEFIISLYKKKIKVCITCHSTVDQHREDKKLFILSKALKLCHRIFVHSIHDLNRLKNIGIISNVTLISHGVLNHHIYLNNKRKSKNKITIASYGFFLPNKGLIELIKAFALLREKKQNIFLKLINARYPHEISDQLIKQAKILIQTLNLEPYVTLNTNFLSDEEALFHLSHTDLIVFPYQQTNESASGAVRYGLSVGVPVAVTPLTIFDDLGEAVFHLPGISYEHIAEGIDTILQKLSTKKEIATKWTNEHSYNKLGPRIETILLSNFAYKADN